MTFDRTDMGLGIQQCGKLLRRKQRELYSHLYMTGYKTVPDAIAPGVDIMRELGLSYH